ncbi:MAG TPA: hypothetical protein VFV50_18460 [Bdellovibrionales bacterium]|nr:hypothetical protein [Bdellovibrionales bacterium]
MFARVTALLVMLGLFVSACGDKSSGRPAPNSVPQQQPHINQAPQATATPTPTPNTQGQNPQNPQQPRQPPAGGQPGQGGQQPGQQPPGESEIRDARVIFFDNGGRPQGTKIKNRTFVVTNFDGKVLPEERKVNTVSVNGRTERVNPREMTHLSDDNYIGCANPACVRKIAHPSEMYRFNSECWATSLSPEVARFDFSFDDRGNLSFIARIDQIRYGAKFIGYRFDGRRTLYIEPFLAAAIINGGESRALSVGGYILDGEDDGSIRATVGEAFGAHEAFILKSTIAIDLGQVRDGQFASSNVGRRYVGGITAAMKPITPVRVRTQDGPSENSRRQGPQSSDTNRDGSRDRDANRDGDRETEE